MIDKVVLIVLDSVGVGELPDAEEYGDKGSNTLGNVSKAVGGLKLPNMGKLGLGNILNIEGVPPESNPDGVYGKAAEGSKGKDTTTGHWEIAGFISKTPFPTYPQGFPRDLIKAFEEGIGTKILGNRVASGTQIIEDLGQHHMDTGYPIVYTSADSVFQIAAHEEVIPLDRLYEICRIAREILRGEHAVARVIARPFVGEPGGFTRTYNRADFSLEPPKGTLLDAVIAAGGEVYGVGKIWDIFTGQGISKSFPTEGNMDGVDKTIRALGKLERGLVFTNLVDFDMLYGHRNDPQGYARALEEFDTRLPEILAKMGAADALIITADHGCDPTFPGTDHTREYVPILVAGKNIKRGVSLGVRQSFADIGQTIGDLLGCEGLPHGKSFKDRILQD